jgi:hypothetical protein
VEAVGAAGRVGAARFREAETVPLNEPRAES